MIGYSSMFALLPITISSEQSKQETKVSEWLITTALAHINEFAWILCFIREDFLEQFIYLTSIFKLYVPCIIIIYICYYLRTRSIVTPFLCTSPMMVYMWSMVYGLFCMMAGVMCAMFYLRMLACRRHIEHARIHLYCINIACFVSLFLELKLLFVIIV